MSYPILAPNCTWYKSTTNKNTITEINIVDSYTSTGSENETWNADVDNTGSIKCYITGTVLTIAGNGSGKIAANADSSYLFAYPVNSASEASYLFTSVAEIKGIDLIDTTSATTLRGAFAYCISLTTLDLSSWNVSNVTSLRMTFGANSQIGTMSLTSLNVSSWDVSKVTNMGSTFQSCRALTTLNVSNWNLSFCTDTSYMFFECFSIADLDVSNWDTSNIIDMSCMFYNCYSLTTLDVSNWDVGNVSTMRKMFSMGEKSSGSASLPIAELDVSKWNTFNVTDMSFMFYAFRPQTRMVDVSGWDVSKVTTFDHMFAHSFLKIGDTSNWKVTTACTNLNALFLSVQNTILDVSGFDTSNVTVFDQMFQGCTLATDIIGLENFNTSKGLGFSEMFQHCYKIKRLDLSSFDTTKAKNGEVASPNGTYTTTMLRMFENMRSLEKITLGPKFSFNGDGTNTNINNMAVLPTPDPTYINDADGNWYDSYGNALLPSEIPNGAGSYYISVELIDEEDLIRRGTMFKLGNVVRSVSGNTNKMTPDQMMIAIKNVPGNNGINITFENYSVIDDGNGNITII